MIKLLFKLKIILNEFRKTLIINLIDENYIDKSLSRRKGRCHYWICKAKCCRNCFALAEDYHCLLYPNNRLNKCYNNFPVDEFELKYYKLDKICGFYWK
jgi:hypothetical protein